MRYEAIWLVQFLFSVGVFAAVFGAGLWVGYRRWGRPGPATWDSLSAEIEVRPVFSRRRDLFAPEVDLRSDRSVAGELAPGTWAGHR